MISSSRVAARSALQLRQRLARARRRGLEPSCEGLESRLVLSGTYAGFVFQDYNANGARDTSGSLPNASGNGSVATARDRGLQGVSVSAFDPAGNLAGSAITAPDGSYSLEASGTGPYRIHFDNLPDGFTPGPQGPDSKTAVQFVPDGGASNISLGAVKPEDFSVDNPFLATQVYSFGSRTGSFANSPAIIGFPYSAGSEYSDPSRSNDPATYGNPAFTTLATHGQVGATWGLAYNRQAGMVYAAAFFKKHSDFGPAGAGAIYQIPVSYDEATGLFTATGAPTVLTTLASASQNAHDPSNFDTDNWNTGWAAAGTTSLGGIDISADGTTLYAMNLADRSLYAIPLADPGGAAAYPVPIPADATGPGGSDIRPFAVTVHDGLVYIGMVNSAESTQDAVDLHSYVYSFDPATGQYAQVLEVRDMTYNRGVLHVRSNGSALWHPWSSTFRTDTTSRSDLGTYTQPMLTSLAFDAAGNLILGIRDRAGDQLGWGARDNPASPNRLYWAIASGDTLRATPNGDDTFTIEQGIYNAPPNESSAFYVDQNAQNVHSKVATGGLAQVPGFLDVATTAMDPANTNPLDSGGVRWLNNTTGRADKAYSVYYSSNVPDRAGHFGKANGMGDLIYMSTQAPVEVGHRLWLDSDRDGIQDPGEPPLAGVTVELRDAEGNLLASVVTDAQGNYTFSSDPRRADTPSAAYGLPLLPGTDYTLVVPPDQPALDRLQRTAADAGGDDAIDSDGQPNGTNGWSLPITTAGPGISENSYDFGFIQDLQQQLSLGDLVWEDRNNNGVVDPGEPGIAGVPIQLLDADGNVVATTTTDADGKYLFTGLAPGDYRVRLTPPSGYRSSTGTNGSASGPYEGAPDPDNDVDNDDNGTASGEFIESAPITLAVGEEPVNDGDDDPNSNLTVDFGLFQPLSLGNLVWEDRNNNGIVDAGEPGIVGVPVQLLDANGNVVATTTTDADGKYLFTGLIPGDYRVRLTPPQGYRSSTGANGAETGPYEPAPDPDNDVDNDDNGAADGEFIESAPITLAVGTEPTNDGDDDPNSNLTVDFGLFQPLSLGNLVWEDRNNNGSVDPDEPGIAGVPVQLLDTNGDVVATTTTDANGNYLFTGLIPGDYRVRLTPPSGYRSSTGANGSASGPYEGAPDPDNDVDNDDNGTTAGAFIESAPITLAVGEEPTNDGDDDPNSNLTVDFGLFQPLSLGNLVWEDRNNNGVVDSGEPGIANVPVQLLDSAGNVVATTTTDLDGKYLFDNLIPGDYRVRLTPPPGYSSSTGTNGSPDGPYEPASDPDNNVDNDDNGTTAGAFIESAPITLAVGAEPVDDGDTNPDSNLTVDFGLFQPLSLGDLVWEDRNNNGVVDPDEPGIAGVPIQLLDADGDVVATTTTDADGKYLFTGLTPGDYRVRLTPPSGYRSSTGANGSPSGPYEPAPDPDNDVNNDDNGTIAGAVIESAPITLAVGAEPVNDGDTNPNSNLTVDFGLFRPLSLGDQVWEDRNNNGTIDEGEPGIAGATVQLLDSAGNVVATTTTGPDGKYLFDNLIPGDYRVRLTPPPGYISSTGTNGSASGPYEGAPDPDNDVDNDDNGTTAGAFIESAPITLAVGAEPTNDGDNDPNSNLTVDFGLFQPLSLGDLVWEDRNNNGVVDPGEPGIAGVPVQLLDADGNVVATTTTDEEGKYLFTGLIPGDYRVRLTPPSGYRSSTGANGSSSGPYEEAPDPDNDVNDDDNGTTSGSFIESAPITLIVGEEPVNDGDDDPNSNLTVDFGLFQPLSLGDLVWEDRNNNGLVDPGEPGIAGVPVQLLDADGNVVATTTTDADGKYLFADLIPGDYRVRLTPPPGYSSSTGTNGSPSGPYEPGADPDSDVDNDDNGTASGEFIESAPITLAVGAEPTNDGDNDPNSNLTVDFGLFQPLSLGNLVWEDRNNNGIVDAGEPGIAGVPVQLLDADGNVVATTTTDADGKYLFTGLVPGNYRVRLTPPSGYRSSTGTNGAETGPYEPGADPDSDVDNDDNGTIAGEFIESAPITLAVGEEPTNDGDDDPNSNLTVDFGLFQPLSLGNLVWEDRNNNGVVDSGEPGIANVPVQLLDSSGNVVATTTTDADGKYLFTGLIPGDYRVRLTPPSGYRSSTGTNGSASGPYEGAPDPDNDVDNDDNGTAAGEFIESAPITLAVGAEPVNDGDDDPNSNLTVDFGLFRPASVGDLVFIDADADGKQGPGEAGVPGIAVRLYDSAGNVVATTTTGPDGKYLFDNLIPGTYSVGFDPATLPPNHAFTVPGQPGTADPSDSDADPNSGRTAPFDLAPGQADMTRDAGLVPLSRLDGSVFVDLDNDGILDPGEPPIPGTTMHLTGVDDLGNPVDLAVVTGPDGSYSFPGLRPGTYSVAQVQPPGYLDGRITPGTAGGVPGENSIGRVVLGPGVIARGYDFGELPSNTCLGGRVYYDLNHNGRLDEGIDFGMAGVSVTLTGIDDRGQAVSLVAITDAEGNYRFEGLRPGTYTLTEAPPRFWRHYATTAGSLGGAASGMRIAGIVVAPGQCGEGYDFGELQPHGPQGKLREAAILVGNAMERLRQRRALDPDRFDAHHPEAGPIIGGGGIPWGRGSFPRAPKFIRRVPTLGSRPVRLGSSAPRVLPMAFRPPASGAHRAAQQGRGH